MDEPHANTLATVAAGRTAAVAQLRQLTDRLERLPLDAAAEALNGLEHVLDELRRQAAHVLERAPTGADSAPGAGSPYALHRSIH